MNSFTDYKRAMKILEDINLDTFSFQGNLTCFIPSNGKEVFSRNDKGVLSANFFNIQGLKVNIQTYDGFLEKLTSGKVSLSDICIYLSIVNTRTVSATNFKLDLFYEKEFLNEIEKFLRPRLHKLEEKYNIEVSNLITDGKFCFYQFFKKGDNKPYFEMYVETEFFSKSNAEEASKNDFREFYYKVSGSYKSYDTYQKMVDIDNQFCKMRYYERMIDRILIKNGI